MKILLLSFILMSCGQTEVTEIENEYTEQIDFELYMNVEMTDGFYRVYYPRQKVSHYTSVEYITEPMTRVYWTSQDTFCIEHMYETFCEPIINYSTYSRDDGSGKQMIYLYRDFVGDTLTVKGCVDVDVCKTVSFIIE